MSDTFVAVVNLNASFSLRKYIDPPVIPSATMVSSSRQLSANHLCCTLRHLSGAAVSSFRRRKCGRRSEKDRSKT